MEEYRLTLKNLEQHYQAFLRDSQDSGLFGADDRMQAENSYNKATQHYDNLLRSVEQGEGQVCSDAQKQSVTFTIHQSEWNCTVKLSWAQKRLSFKA